MKREVIIMLNWTHLVFNLYDDNGNRTDKIHSEFWSYIVGVFSFDIYWNADQEGYRAMIIQQDNSEVLKVNNDSDNEHKVYIYLKQHETFEEAETAMIDVFKNFYNMISNDYFKLTVLMDKKGL
jgi:hypothetical protein